MYNSHRHLSLPQEKWDFALARQIIEKIATETLQVLNSPTGVPCHPLDEQPFGSDFYYGMSGVLWALLDLGQKNFCVVDQDFSFEIDRLILKNQEECRASEYPENSSYFFGELPLWLLKFKIKPDQETSNKIYELIVKNTNAPILDLMFGLSGGMLCAYFMHEWTLQSRWQDLFQKQMQILLAGLVWIDGVGAFWESDLEKVKKKYLSALHGFSGNVLPLLKGKNMIAKHDFSKIKSFVFDTICNTAREDENYANWPAVYYEDNRLKPIEIVQICHGAPGIICFLSDLPIEENQRFDLLFQKAAEMIWMLGPLKKGSNLCHGTAGNGFAFLKMFKRTNDEIWLDRARAFAMHAIRQYESEKQQFHQGRYTLWTGDLGLAGFLENCLAAKADFPTIDVF